MEEGRKWRERIVIACLASSHDFQRGRCPTRAAKPLNRKHLRPFPMRNDRLFLRLTLAIALYAYAFDIIKAIEPTLTRNRHNDDGSHDNGPVGKMVEAGRRLGETRRLPRRNNPAKSLKNR